MFSLKDVAGKADACYGCGACVNACEAGALRLRPDGDGFLRPVCDEVTCVDCGVCEAVCPRLAPDYTNESPGKCLAVMADDAIRKKSSTGGVFTLLARYVLDGGGTVFGAELSRDFLVRHVGVDTERDLARLRGSKYAQSDPGMTYAEAKAILESGRPVLYCGCPCQIAGLRKFLGKDHDDLVTADLLCSGNPSAYGLREYLDDTWGLDNICGMRFRRPEGWDYGFEVFLKSGEIVREESSPYLRMFLRHALNKPSCVTCQFQKLPRQGDFTLGDFWNVGTLAPEMDDGLGTAVVLLNNAKARRIWDEVSKRGVKAVREFTVDEAYGSGVTYLLRGPEPYPGQAEFDGLRRESGLTEAVRKTADHYDVGIAGTWLANYGTISSNWALYNVIRSFGLSACILDVTGHEWMDGLHPIPDAIIRAKGIPRASAFCEKGDYGSLNGHCGMFVTASDQLWGNIPTYMDHAEYMYLGFTNPGKRLVAAGTAIGKPDMPYDENQLERRREWLSRFSYIGVREDFGPEVLKDAYGAEAEHIQDPVFLCDKTLFLHEAGNATFRPAGRFVFAYMIYAEWDGPEFALAKKFAKARGCGLIMSRGLGPDILEYDADLDLIGRHATYYRNWMRCMADADFVLTNSFHGVCMPLILGKDLAAVHGREPERLDVLARDFGIGDRIFGSVDGFDMGRMVREHMDHERIGALVEAEGRRGREALRAALLGPAGGRRGQEGDTMGKKHVAGKLNPGWVMGRAGGPCPEDRFRARLRAEALRVPGSDYLEYVRGIGKPDLASTVLVEIPSYNDPEIVNTINAARAMAANPDRVRFAICLQDDDKDRIEALSLMPYAKLTLYALKDAPGGCAARYECQRLYGGEDFVLHMDAHMRFARAWDAAMIDQWSMCGSEKAVLTDYASGVEEDELGLPVDAPVFTERARMACGVVRALYFQGNVPELRMHVPFLYGVGRPMRGAFVCAHCMFGRPSVDQAVPVDPKMDFVADESSVAARLWTHGFDIWHAGARCVYHYYNTRAADPAHDHRTSLDLVEGGISRQERQARRLEKLLGVYDRQDVDLSGFGLGTERSLAAYQEYCGVDFRAMTIRRFAFEGRFDVGHDDKDLEFVDWVGEFEKRHGPFPDHGRKLDLNVRPDAADEFLKLCAELHVRPQAALIEAVRQWTDNRKRGGS